VQGIMEALPLGFNLASTRSFPFDLALTGGN